MGKASEVVAIVAGEPRTIRTGDYVEIRWAGYGGVRGSAATHDERSTDREPGRGTFVAAVTPDLVDASGRRRGPAIRLDGQHHVKPSNVLAVTHLDTGEVVGRWLPLYRADGRPTSQIVDVLGPRR